MPTSQLPIALGLAALMLLTRLDHFGSPFTLPDASWAVFALAGFYLRPWVVLPLFLAAAGLIDYAAIHNGVSDWCVTAGYLLLIPAYGSLWLAGRWYAGRAHFAWATLIPLATALLAGVGAAFLISNVGFYLWSGYFTDLSWAEYGARVAKYFPAYLASTCMYVMLAACVHLVAAQAGRTASAARGTHG